LVKFVDDIPTTASSRFNVWVRIFGALPTMVDDSFAADFKRFSRKKDEGGNFYPKYFKWLAKLELPEVAGLDAGAKKRVEAMTKRAKALAKGPAPIFETSAKPTEAKSAPASALDPVAAMHAARDAMRAAKWEEAMRHLQTAWAKTRDEPLAELIEQFTLAVGPHIESAPSSHRAWLAREAKQQSLDVQPLLDARNAGSETEGVQKLGRLLAWPEDSRIARFLAVAIDEGWGKTSADYWTVILDLAVKHGAPALGALLDEFGADIRPDAASHFPYWRPRQRQILRVRDAFRERMTRIEKLPDSVRPLFAELRALFPKAPEHPEAAMIAEIVASPSDDPRLVFADWLMEKGDPLGEWISVQCGLAKNPTDRKLLARQNALSKTNKDRDALLGPLRKVIENKATFHRGMLFKVTARGDEKSDRVHHAHPRLATVEELDLWWVEDDTAFAFAQSPALVSLRRIRHLKYETTYALATSKRALPVERIEGIVQRNEQTEEERALLAEAPGLPALRVLGIWYEENGVVPEWILGGALGKRLQKIACRDSSVEKWRAAIAKLGLPIEVIVEDPH
ncbi:MAG: TIGR02996 domain-containing protein, partial [Polyangiales bacterium]